MLGVCLMVLLGLRIHPVTHSKKKKNYKGKGAKDV